jgi:hypothetical protein
MIYTVQTTAIMTSKSSSIWAWWGYMLIPHLCGRAALPLDKQKFPSPGVGTLVGVAAWCRHVGEASGGWAVWQPMAAGVYFFLFSFLITSLGILFSHALFCFLEVVGEMTYCLFRKEVKLSPKSWIRSTARMRVRTPHWWYSCGF